MNKAFEDTLVRIFARRSEITTKPDDPERLEAILDEWRLMIALIDQGWRRAFD